MFIEETTSDKDKQKIKRIMIKEDRIAIDQGIGIKGREMTLVWHEKASRTALQTSSV